MDAPTSGSIAKSVYGVQQPAETCQNEVFPDGGENGEINDQIGYYNWWNRSEPLLLESAFETEQQLGESYKLVIEAINDEDYDSFEDNLRFFLGHAADSESEIIELAKTMLVDLALTYYDKKPGFAKYIEDLSGYPYALAALRIIANCKQLPEFHDIISEIATKCQPTHFPLIGREEYDYDDFYGLEYSEDSETDSPQRILNIGEESASASLDNDPWFVHQDLDYRVIALSAVNAFGDFG